MPDEVFVKDNIKSARAFAAYICRGGGDRRVSQP